MVRGRSTRPQGPPEPPPQPPPQRVSRVGRDRRATQRAHVHPAGGRLDYGWQWDLNAGDEITKATVAVTVAGGSAETLTASGAHGQGDVVAVWLTGGDAGSDYTVTCRIVTAQGRRDEQSLRVLCRRR